MSLNSVLPSRWIGLSDENMTTAETTPDINKPPPIRDPTARKMPSSSPDAAKAVIYMELVKIVTKVTLEKRFTNIIRKF